MRNGSRPSTEQRFTPLVDWKTLAQNQDPAATAPEIVLPKTYVCDEIRALTDEAGQPTRRVRFCISTASVDREGDTISVDGWRLDNYRRNPVVQWAHDYYAPPIGNSVELGVVEERLVSIAQFVEPEIYPFAETVFQLLLHRYLHAASVGFRPLRYEFNEERPGRGFGPPIDFLEHELLEWSVVPVPCNAEALVEARSVGIDLAPLKAWAEQMLDEWHGEPGLWLPKEKVEAAYKVLEARKTVPLATSPVAAPDDSPAAKAADTPAAKDDGLAVEKAADHAGLLVALWLEPSAASVLAIPDGEPAENLHITLAYCGGIADFGASALAGVLQGIEALSHEREPLHGQTGGYLRFQASPTSDGQDVFAAAIDVPGLSELREAVCDRLRAVGVEPSAAHGFTPHCTLAYLEAGAANPVEEVPAVPLHFTALTLGLGSYRLSLNLEIPADATGDLLALAAAETETKADGDDGGAPAETKQGRVLSSRNEQRIREAQEQARQAQSLLDDVLATLGTDVPEAESAGAAETRAVEADDEIDLASIVLDDIDLSALDLTPHTADDDVLADLDPAAVKDLIATATTVAVDAHLRKAQGRLD